MNETIKKQFPTIGCCGIDCGLCPRYYTDGNSRCPGCCNLDFFNKHPSCGLITCCVKNKGLEVCAECANFPCIKLNPWLKKDTYDSFVTHKKVKTNLDFIKKFGINAFIKNQKKRIELLRLMLQRFNDGKSKNFYCLAATLLSIKGLEESIHYAEKNIESLDIGDEDTKEKAKILKSLLQKTAKKEDIELTLNKPPNWKK